MTRASKLLLVPLFVLQLCFFSYIALHRFIEGDEGFYLLASRMALMHKKPYVDFFYTQAPLLPYVYALWMKYTGVSWISAKLFSALLTALLGVVLYGHLHRQTRHWWSGVFAVTLFVSSTAVFAWFPVVKTYSLSALFLFVAYVIVTSASPPRWLMGAGGILLGLTIDTRSYLLLLVPVFLWWIYRACEANLRLKYFLWFAAGIAIGLLPSLYLFLASPDAFLFNNLGYHALRSGEGLIGMWKEKLVIVPLLFLGNLQGNGLQNSILFFVSLAFVFSLYKGYSAPRFAFQLAIAIAVISLLPSPVFPQYFCLCAPFLIVSFSCVVDRLFSEITSKRRQRLAVAGCICLLLVYVVASLPDFRRYLITGDQVPGVRVARNKDDWKLQRVLEVSRAIDQLAAPGEAVASFSPGDIFQTHSGPLPGLESDFGLPIAEMLTPQQRARYHILSQADIEAEFAAQKPRVVVVGDQILVSLTAPDLAKWNAGENYRKVLLARGYVLTKSIGGKSIYVCCRSDQRKTAD